MVLVLKLNKFHFSGLDDEWVEWRWPAQLKNPTMLYTDSHFMIGVGYNLNEKRFKSRQIKSGTGGRNVRN